ncbi:Myb-like DNA-binding domain containing protein [Histomonas meleagridis]|uniref:Myb-like DNA-binding domain containing protein n=1 Tax=Histomonas meleagridis TaxID=135588 RepID=UPI00355ABA2F|nr:Myb-like DNA-binding domain containing protein [Histomonas meleagridis]KAH0802327.1 Myb-like DNA-binding domain containing protein [Histomonas meleagridis]
MAKVNWKFVANQMEGRTARQCRERYKNYLSPNIRSSPWTPEEDALLLQKYQEFGPCWSFMKQFFDKRESVSLKNRYAKLVYKPSKQGSARQKKSDSIPPTDGLTNLFNISCDVFPEIVWESDNSIGTFGSFENIL